MGDPVRYGDRGAGVRSGRPGAAYQVATAHVRERGGPGPPLLLGVPQLRGQRPLALQGTRHHARDGQRGRLDGDAVGAEDGGVGGRGLLGQQEARPGSPTTLMPRRAMVSTRRSLRSATSGRAHPGRPGTATSPALRRAVCSSRTIPSWMSRTYSRSGHPRSSNSRLTRRSTSAAFMLRDALVDSPW